MNTFVKKCKQVIRRRIRAIKKLAHDPDEQFNKVLAHLILQRLIVEKTQSPVIFDVGAHHGESITRFKKLFATATIHSFEPDKDNFMTLEKNWSDKNGIVLNNIGVSAKKGTLTFHRNLKSNTSGFHDINVDSDWAKNRSARYDVPPEEYTEKSYDVPVTDLDSYIQDNNISRINLLKIDTQCHEDEVLIGCKFALKNGVIDIIETELVVGNPYVKSLQFYDLEQVLIPAGYKFYGIDNSGNLLNAPSLCFNVIYVHEKFFE